SFDMPRLRTSSSCCEIDSYAALNSKIPKTAFKLSNSGDNFCVIRSFLDMLHKRSHGMLDVLQHPFVGNSILSAA
ncbi:hypothetical protein LXA47_13670, partial [Massilia sp. P8910]|uniref:hypothetical protein n=1 Tax=Massilia antarctica TaxID=2765360 RepID=UPI0028134EF2|nr:hypothetical protein [Massilia antarctica]